MTNATAAFARIGSVSKACAVMKTAASCSLPHAAHAEQDQSMDVAK